MELFEELLEPTSFSHAVGHDMILSLDARAGDDVLAFGGPGDEVVIEKHNVAWGGPACIRATYPVHICKDEQGGVRLGLNKSQSDEVRGEPAVPSSGRLLHPVDRLFEAADPIMLRVINKPRRLAAIDYLRESTMPERVLHIKLVDRPGTWDGQGKHRSDDGRALGEATKNPTSLVLFQGVIEVKWTGKSCVTYWGNQKRWSVTNNDGWRISGERRSDRG
jgi:hypothetical protein